MNFWIARFLSVYIPWRGCTTSHFHRPPYGQEDIQNSIIWAGALLEADILTPDELVMVQALTAISDSFMMVVPFYAR